MTFENKFNRTLDAKVKIFMAEHFVKRLSDWQTDLLSAEITERVIQKRFEKRGWIVSKVPQSFHYDLLVQKNGVTRRIEVKSFKCSYGNYDAAYFETKTKDGNVPEYIRHKECVDLMIRLNTFNGLAFVLDNTELNIAIANAGIAQSNSYGTSEGHVLFASHPVNGYMRMLS
jgi:hypothetical protein